MTPSQEPRVDLGGLTEAQVIASGYTIEDFKRRKALAAEAAEDGNRRWRAMPRWGLPDTYDYSAET